MLRVWIHTTNCFKQQIFKSDSNKLLQAIEVKDKQYETVIVELSKKKKT